MAIIQQIENGKLVDSSASNTSLSTENKSDAAGGALDKDAFLQLLVAQMQYQDPLEPTDITACYIFTVRRDAEPESESDRGKCIQLSWKICICKSNQ